MDASFCYGLYLVDEADGRDLLVALAGHLDQPRDVLVEQLRQVGLLQLISPRLHPGHDQGPPADVRLVDEEDAGAGDGGGRGVLERVDLEHHAHRVREWHTLVRHEGQHLEGKRREGRGDGQRGESGSQSYITHIRAYTSIGIPNLYLYP